MTAPKKRKTRMEKAASLGIPARAWVSWGAAALTYVIAIFNRGSLGVAGPMAADRLGIDATALSSFAAVQLAVFAATQVPVGLVVDRYGPRTMLTASLAVMAAGQAMVAGSHSFALVLTGRALLGCGDAMVMISVLRLITSWFPPARIPILAQVTIMVGTAGGLAAAPPLSAALRAFGWERVFFSSALATAFMTVGVWVSVRNAPEEDTPSAIRGSSTETLRTALGAAWRQPATAVGLWLMFTVHFPVQVFVLLWGYPFLTQGQGVSAATASYLVAVPLVVTMALGPVFGIISARRSHWRLPLILTITCATTVTWAAVLLWPGEHAPLALLFLLTAVLGLCNPAAVFGLDIARSGSPPHRVGAASGIANIGGYTAALLAMMLIGAALDHRQGTAATPDHADFRVAMATQLVLQVLGVSLLLRSRSPSRD
ncbi:nitrate/nitrite transporter [Streptomyces sp. NPDC017940]|uniref:nitrate/nitrite transporter n=1 Tax=Streptomyces sp. NPDC017940 TaxID=3365017 RepID=UPI00379A3996